MLKSCKPPVLWVFSPRPPARRQTACFHVNGVPVCCTSASFVCVRTGEADFSETLGVECACFCRLFHLVCHWVKSRGTRAKPESKPTLQQSLTEHYFLCKDTTCTYILCRKTLLEIGKYFFKVKILKCKDTHGKDFSITLTISETLLRNAVLLQSLDHIISRICHRQSRFYGVELSQDRKQ